jgi:copper resistance protein B
MPVGDQQVYAHVLFDEFEGRFASTDRLRWDGEGWVGTDTQRLWIKSEGFAGQGSVADGQHEVLYDRPISSFFDLQAGLRYDWDSHPGRGWVAAGVEGLAPYFLKVSATLYASDGGHFAARITAAYEMLLTDRLILEPQIELNGYTRADPERQVESGVGVDAGLRLRYEITRKLAPYAGLTYEHPIAPTGSAAQGEHGSLLSFALGLRAWL